MEETSGTYLIRYSSSEPRKLVLTVNNCGTSEHSLFECMENGSKCILASSPVNQRYYFKSIENMIMYFQKYPLKLCGVEHLVTLINYLERKVLYV